MERHDHGSATFTRSLRLGSLLLGFAAAGCSAPDAASGYDAKTVDEEVARLMRREHPQYPKHDLRLLDGLASAKAESKSKPRVECENGKESVCVVQLDMGKDEEGEPASVICSVSTDLVPFGLTVHESVQGGQLINNPSYRVEAVDAGIINRFAADAVTETADGVFLSSVKVASLYSKGYVATCIDIMAGGKKTFQRVAHGFLSSLELEDNPGEPVVYAAGYVQRAGKRALGFRYTYLTRTDDGLVELGTSFKLNQTKDKWTTFDHGRMITRDDAGRPKRYRSLHWLHGRGPLTITAKPTERGRYRIKREIDGKTDALEITPKAPLETEIGVALKMRGLAHHEATDFRYAFPAIDEDGDPTLLYSVLQRDKTGVVLEETRSHNALDRTADEPASELHVDEDGAVTRQVDSKSTFELVYRIGKLPRGRGK